LARTLLSVHVSKNRLVGWTTLGPVIGSAMPDRKIGFMCSGRM
jgi:hypothetical protein